jgi:hypothetical protein
MKQVPWVVLKPEVVKNTVWEKIDDTKLKLDFKEIEALFSAKPAAAPAVIEQNINMNSLGYRRKAGRIEALEDLPIGS